MAIINRLSRSGRSRVEIAFWILFFGSLAVGGLGYGIYQLTLKDSDTRGGANTGGSSAAADGRPRMPSGWKQYSYSESGFSAWFPTEPARKVPEPDKPAQKFPYRSFSYRSEVRSGVMVRVWVYPIDANLPQEDRNDGIVHLRNWILSDRVGSQPRVTEWCGMRCLEFVEPVDKNKKLGGISRLLVTKSHVYCVSILGFDSEPPADLRVAGFEGFNLLSGEAVDRDSEAVLADLGVRWEAHEFPRQKFKASFSGKPTSEKLSGDPNELGGMPIGTKFRARSGLDVVETAVIVYDLRPGLSRIARAAMIEGFVEAITKKAKADERDSSDAIEVTLDGQPAQEITIRKNMGGDVARLLTTESHLYLLVINSQNRWPTDDERKRFFDSFHVLK